MAVSFHKFIERLNRSGLLTTEALQPLLAAVPKDQRPGSAESLARWLVKAGHLTPFQAKAIFLGKTRGMVVGNYVILDLLGVGGMGQVYKARHRRMNRVVAIKLLAPKVARQPRLVQRFHQEVEAAARLMHPNIVTAFDADEADGKHFLVMEYVPGRDLASIIKERGPLSVNRSIRCVLDAARGLEFAHRHGVVHRDVKPSNLLLASKDGNSHRDEGGSTCVKILDMGLARIEEEAVNTPSDLTKTGIVMGTVDYMSPEQAVNTHEADHRSDIYSLGITLYYLLTGEVPFTGRTVIEQVLAHRETKIPSLKKVRRDIPVGLDPIFRTMIAKKPEDRFQSMGDVVAALEHVLTADESAADLPILIDDAGDDTALAGFLESMSGNTAAQQRAAAAVITPASEDVTSDTLVSSGRSTAVARIVPAIQQRKQGLTWGPIALHSSWSLALLGLACWMFIHSRANGPGEISDGTIMDAGLAGHPTQQAEDEEIEYVSDDPPATTSTSDVEQQFAEWILKIGGTVKVAEASSSRQVTPGQELPHWEFSVTAITLPAATIGSGDLARLAEASQLGLLKSLVLAGNPAIDDDWITSLATFSGLNRLNLQGTAVTDAAVALLPERFPMLEILSLENCQIGAGGLDPLSQLKLLKQLSLRHVPLKSEAVASLKSLKSLRQLDVRDSSLSAADIRALKESLPNCTILADSGSP